MLTFDIEALLHFPFRFHKVLFVVHFVYVFEKCCLQLILCMFLKGVVYN